MAEFIGDGAGSGHVAKVGQSGGLVVAATTGTDIRNLLVNDAGELLTTASLGDVTAVNESVAKITGVHTGSATLIAGNFNGSTANIIMDGGSFLQIAGSISSMPSVSATNASVGKEGTPHAGSPTMIGADFNGSLVTLLATDGSELIVTGSVSQLGDWVGSLNIATSPVPVSGLINIQNIGSVRTLGGIGSVRLAEQGIDIDVLLGSTSIHGDVQTLLGSTSLHGVGSVVNLGSVEVWQTTAGDMAVNIGDIGSVRVTGFGGGSVAVTNGSINIYGDISTSDPSVKEHGTPVPGSVGMIGANFNGSAVGVIATEGSELLVAHLGSVEVWQDTNSDMQVQATQEGTWDINNLTTGSVRVVSQAVTTRQITAGSILLEDENGVSPLFDNRRFAGSIVSMPSISATNESVYALSGIIENTGSATLIGAQYNGSLWSLRMDNGSHLMIAGSISSMPSITASNESVAEITGDHLGSATIVAGNFNGSTAPLLMQAGSDLRVVTLGSIEIWQDTATDVNVDIGNIGSVRVTGFGGGSVAVTNGSINIYGDISASNPSVKAHGTPVPGSVTLIAGNFNGSSVGIIATEGSELLVGALGSIEVWQDTNSDMQVQATQEGTWDINNLTTGSVRVVSQAVTTRQITAGSIKILGASGADSYPLLVTSGTVARLETNVNNITTGSVRVVSQNAWTGVGSVRFSGGIGSIRIAQQGVNVQTLLGSTAIHGNVQTLLGSTSIHGIGSIRIAQEGVKLRTLEEPIVHDGSVLVDSGGIGSTILPTLLNTIKWISVLPSGNAPGSIYAFGIDDAQGYMIQSALRHVNKFSQLTPIMASGVLVYNISGTAASGTYHFRTAYI